MFKVQYPDKLSETKKKQIYELLTEKKYNSSQIHKIPKDEKIVNLTKASNNSSCYSDEDDGYNPRNQRGERVECAQQ